MLKKLLWGVFLLALAALIWFLNKPQMLLVETYEVKPGLIESLVSNTRAGTVTACQRSRLALSLGGQIAVINVVEGQQVKKGAALLQLWNKDLKAQVEAAQAGIGSANYEKQSLCIQSRADQRESARQNDLDQQKLTSERIRDDATTKANSSAAACTASKARIEQAKAIFSQARASLDKTYLIAPFDGTVAEVTGEVGEFLTPSPPGVATPPAVDLITANCHYIKAPIDEVDAGHIKVDMPVRISLDAFRGQSFNGEVKRIAPYVQDYSRQARTVEVEVSFAPQQLPQLLAGYSVDVEIILATSVQSLRIPTGAIIDNTYVYILNEQGLIEKINVTIGINNWQFSEVTSGLKQGQQVLVSAISESIIPGARAKTQ